MIFRHGEGHRSRFIKSTAARASREKPITSRKAPQNANHSRVVVEALRNLDNGGRLVVNAIRKETVDQDYLLKLDYPTHLWMEKEIKSVANVTRSDVREFLTLAAEAGIRPEYQEYPLEGANQALTE